MRMISARRYGVFVTTWIRGAIIQYLKNRRRKKLAKLSPVLVSTEQGKRKSTTISTATGRILSWQLIPLLNQLTANGRNWDLGPFFLRLRSNSKARYMEKKPL